MAWLGTAALVVGGSTTSANAATAAAPTTAPLLSATEAIAGEYIVVLKDDTSKRASGLRTTSSLDRVRASAEHGRTLGAVVNRQFKSAIQGYAATLSASELAAVRKDPEVAYVQPNRVFQHQASTEGVTPASSIQTAGTTTQNPKSWGLDRVDQRNLPLDKKYYATATGKGVTAFIVDTGIAAGHQDLKNVRAGVDLVGDGQGTNDCNGHGTHVAGTVGGKVYGVAKEVTLVPIRVLDCGGNGSTESVVAGLDAVLAMGIAGPKVVNMSLGADYVDPVVDAAVKRVVAGGITAVIAAGNGDANGNPMSACAVSPARVKTAITVSGTTIKDKRISWANHGSCVDLYAPGENITSDWIGAGGNKVETISGTSMATPHVAGAAAMYLQRHPKATPAQVQTALISTATANKVTNVSKKWPRLMAFALQKAVVPKSVTSGNKLRNNESLVKGNKICSTGGTYCLNHTTAGKLQLRKVKGANKRVVWSAGKSTKWTQLTTAGALTSYDAYGRPMWTSKKTGGQATLTVIKTGYLKIVRNSDNKVLWTSKS